MSKTTIKYSLLLVTLLLVTAIMLSTPLTVQSSSPAADPVVGEVTFPELTGSYKVGRVAYEWVDQSRDEIYASIPGLKRDLMVYIWFPASVTKRSKPVQYMDAGMGWALMNFPELGDKVHSHAYRSSILDTDKPSYPVLIFVHGYGATSLIYSSIIEEIASHGYIVIGTSHPYSGIISYPDKRLVGIAPSGKNSFTDSALLKVWTQDVQFVLDQAAKLNTSDETFKGHLDLTNIGILGHGFGGSTAAQATAVDSRIKAGADLDGATAMQGGTGGDPSYVTDTMSQPFLFVGAGAVPSLKESTNGKYWLIIDGTMDTNYGDWGLLKPLFPDMRALGNIDPARGIQITNAYLVTFFDHYLKGSALNWPAYDEAKVTPVEATK